MNIADLGWNDFFSRNFDKFESQGLIPARVAREERERYQILCETGELTGEITGKLRHSAESRLDFPAVGDWVAISPFEDIAIIHGVLPRKSKFLRKDAGLTTDEQVVAANVDFVFLVTGLDNDFNIRRLERYLTSAWDSGAKPVIVLNKTDLCENLEERLEEVGSSAVGCDILPISAKSGDGIDAVRGLIAPGVTAAFLGSSGVGKSTIINAMLGEERLKTGAVREYDQRGRHTSTWRELITLPDGGIVIDTPGMRLLKLWSGDESLAGSFDDIEELAKHCKFGDCTHGNEPGCAVQKAMETGELDEGRYGNYLKMQKEIAFLERRKDAKASAVEKAKWKEINQRQRELKKYRKDRGIKT